MSSINTYYSRIINLIIELYHSEFESASAGHCMKITGLSETELNTLWEILKGKYPHLATYIISDAFASTTEKYLSATKLIELRNQHDKPLLILIPANSRTAAEDSYGNATFKEISLDIIEQKLYEKLLSEIPPQYDSIIKTILNYPYPHDLQRNHLINYLIGVLENNISESTIGNCLYHLELLPDETLLKENEKVRTRLNFNISCTEIVTNYSRSLYERVSELPIENNTIQKDIVDLFKTEENIKSRKEICQTIFEKYPKLNFTYWAIPDLNFERIELSVDEISSNDFIIEDGKKVLNAQNGKISKVKIRFSTSPNPCDIEDLDHFRIVLAEVDGASGTEIMELRKYKNSDSRRQYRDAQIELNPSLIEEGSYFLRVYAEDEHGTILNVNDKYKDIKIQRQWEEESNELRNNYEGGELSQKLKELEIEYNYKKTCDSEDFDFIIEEEPSEPAPIRRDKINCALQAYFQYRIEKLKSKEELDLPVVSDDSGIWVNDMANKLLSTYYLKYNSKHVYQSIIPLKLRLIESLIIKHCKSFGYADITLYSNPSANALKSSDFRELDIVNQLVPKKILNLREELFGIILKSSRDDKGNFETFDFYNHIDLIRQYLSELTQWTTQLKDKFDNLSDLDAEKRAELQNLFIELQNIDTVRISTKLPDKTPLDVLVLSPLHPLRLTWHLQLFDLYADWEKKTLEFEGHINEWYKNIENLFIGQLYPENNPLVFVSIYNNKAYQYAGELQYGWGIYIRPETNYNIEAISSVNRQIKAYIRNLLNISSESYIDTEISQQLVIKHVKNYIIQHPYTNKLNINLFNAGDATVFANVLIELEQENKFGNISYDIRLFKGSDSIINHGIALKNLINPEFTVSEEAEAFSQLSLNKLFPKLRFSVNNIKDYLSKPEDYSANLSFLVSPFPSKTELLKVRKHYTNFYLNGIIMSPSVIVEDSDKETKWNRFVYPNVLTNQINEFSNTGIALFANIQSFVAGALVSNTTQSFPSTQLHLNEKDNVLISLVHDNSDWVITFDKNLGPQIFDQPCKNGHIPFLLDYIPGEELLGISSFLTTRPTSEILGLLAPHFKEFNIDILNPDNGKALNILLEDLRAISSSLVLQLNSGKNKAFEVIGSAFTKRVLEKKEYLKDSFLIPIDLHQNLFENTPLANKSRADNLLVSIDTENRVIEITVIEIKCRKSLSEQEKHDLKEKVKDQIKNTIEVFKYHFDPENNLSSDRLDRFIKNKELKSLLEFYINRANRYGYLEDEVGNAYLNFLNTIDAGYRLSFKQRGFIFNFSSDIKHLKETIDSELTFFTFGKKLIDEILDPDSDLNTTRLEKDELKEDLIDCSFRRKDLSDFIKGFNAKESTEYIEKEEIRADAHEPENNLIVKTEIQTEQKKVGTSGDTEIIIENKDRPIYDIIIGKPSESEQFGILGKTIHGKKIAIDLSETNTISLFGVQGGGKSYSIGTVTEMVLKQFQNINCLPAPLAGVIFHFSESMDYEPEFTSMKYPNDKKAEIDKLISEYKSKPDIIEDIVILTPKDKVEERQEEYPNIKVFPIAFNSMELTVQDWLFLLGAIGNDSTYIKQLKSIMKDNRKDLSLINISNGVEETELLSSSQKALARQKLNFAGEYINDSFNLKEVLRPGRLIIVDLRDEFIVKDDALGLFVIMLNIFSSVKSIDDKRFNKFIVFDEAHKYMDNKALTNSIVTSIREMRHKGVSIMIASQDPPSLPNEIIELSSIVIVHKFNSPQWLKHIQKSITQLNPLQASDLSALNPGEAFLWATKSDDRNITNKPTKIYTRPRVTKHGGGTIKATDN